MTDETMLGDEFRQVKIGDMGEVITGTTPPTERDELFGKKYPFITPGDINNGARYTNVNRFLSEEGKKSQSNKLLPTDSVCFTCIGATIGKICMTNEPSFTNQQINSIVVNKDKFDPFYIFYLLRENSRKIVKRASGAATPIVNKTSFSNIKMKVPSLNKQKKISSVLSTFDDLIENNKRRIESLEEMAETIYREWFVNFNFPGSEDVEMNDSDLGPMPEGFKVKKLDEICEITIGTSPKSKFYNDEGNGLPFHQGVSDFGRIFPKENRYCSKIKRVAEKGELLFSVRAPVGRMNIADQRIVIGRGLYALKAKNGFQEFLIEQMKYKFPEDNVMGSGTVFNSVNKKIMKNLDLIYPQQALLKKFTSVVRPTYKEMEKLTNLNKILQQARDLLLPRLISGEVKV